MKQRKINPAAIAALKRIMPDRETRQMFIDECIKAHGKDFESKWMDDIMLDNEGIYGNTLRKSNNSFVFHSSKLGFDFWAEKFDSLTGDEINLKIFLP